jgi:hypothetical protein
MRVDKCCPPVHATFSILSQHNKSIMYFTLNWKHSSIFFSIEMFKISPVTIRDLINSHSRQLTHSLTQSLHSRDLCMVCNTMHVLAGSARSMSRCSQLHFYYHLFGVTINGLMGASQIKIWYTLNVALKAVKYEQTKPEKAKNIFEQTYIVNNCTVVITIKPSRNMTSTAYTMVKQINYGTYLVSTQECKTYTNTRNSGKSANLQNNVVISWYTFSILELEALEACYWLRATGFPQYAQMYEGNCEHSVSLCVNMRCEVVCLYDI